MLAVSAASATDNATSDFVSIENQSDHIISEKNNNRVLDDDNTSADTSDELLEISQDRNISCSENNLVLEKDSASAPQSESPLYGIVDLGSNTMELHIYHIKNNGKPKSLFSLSEKSVTAVYVENNNLTAKGIDKMISILK